MTRWRYFSIVGVCHGRTNAGTNEIEVSSRLGQLHLSCVCQTRWGSLTSVHRHRAYSYSHFAIAAVYVLYANGKTTEDHPFVFMVTWMLPSASIYFHSPSHLGLDALHEQNWYGHLWNLIWHVNTILMSEIERSHVELNSYNIAKDSSMNRVVIHCCVKWEYWCW